LHGITLFRLTMEVGEVGKTVRNVIPDGSEGPGRSLAKSTPTPYLLNSRFSGPENQAQVLPYVYFASSDPVITR